MFRANKQSGVTMMEVLVGIGLVVMISTALYLALFNIVKTMGDSKQRVGATALANERMEVMRSLVYDKVGIINGIVPGPIDGDEELEKNGFRYRIKTDVRYIDDPYDGVFPADTVNNDYKQIQIEVYWVNGGRTKSVFFSSKIVPNGIETNLNGGTLSINVASMSGTPVSNAQVHIQSVNGSQSVDVTVNTDESGNLVFPGTPAQDYRITVTKADYETVQTYPNPPASGFTPIDPDVKVTAGDIVAKTFLVAHSSDLIIKAQNVKTGNDLSGMHYTLLGGRKTGNDPATYTINQQEYTTNSSGEISLENISPGTYSFVDGGCDWSTDDYQYVGSDVTLPITLTEGESKTVTLLYAEKDTNSLFLNIVDKTTGLALAGAEVHVRKDLFDQTLTSSKEGYVYFPPNLDPPVTMEAGQYSVEVTLSGYRTNTSNIDVSGLKQNKIEMEIE